MENALVGEAWAFKTGIDRPEKTKWNITNSFKNLSK
jgi:hypothetical protein